MKRLRQPSLFEIHETDYLAYRRRVDAVFDEREFELRRAEAWEQHARMRLAMELAERKGVLEVEYLWPKCLN